MQRIRYKARKYGLRCLRVNEAYKLYRAADGKLVDSVNGVTCNRVFTRAELEEFFATLNAVKISAAPEINL